MRTIGKCPENDMNSTSNVTVRFHFLILIPGNFSEYFKSFPETSRRR